VVNGGKQLSKTKKLETADVRDCVDVDEVDRCSQCCGAILTAGCSLFSVSIVIVMSLHTAFARRRAVRSVFPGIPRQLHDDDGDDFRRVLFGYECAFRLPTD